MDVLNKILKLREARGWTEYRLAEEADLPQSTISSWYNPNRDISPTIASMEKICKAFRITLPQLFAEGEEAVTLTAEQKHMLEVWNTLTDQQKDALFQFLKVL